MNDAERWDAIWEGAFETLRRLFEGTERLVDELAAALESPASVESEDEPEVGS